MQEMTKEEANKIVSEKLKQSQTLIEECIALADEHGLRFESPVKQMWNGKPDGPRHNDRYYGKNMDLDEENRQCESYDDIRGHWISSSDWC